MAHSAPGRLFARALRRAGRDLRSEDHPGERPAPWTRRRFVKAAALAAGGTLGATMPLPAFARGTGGARIAVVGGGLAGLSAALRLRDLGLDATVYEARRRLGGRVFTRDDVIADGLAVDLGGMFVNTDHQDMLALAKRFGLPLFDRARDAETRSVPESAYFLDGRLVPESELAALLRPLAKQIGRDAEKLDDDFDRFAPQFDALSVTQYLDRHAERIGEPFVRRLVEGTIRSEYGVEPDQASALELLFVLPTVEGDDVTVLGNSDEAFVVRGGSGRVVAALAGALDGHIRTGLQLVRIEPAGRALKLTFGPTRNQTLPIACGPELAAAASVGTGSVVVLADYVVLATPFTALRRVDLRVPLPKLLRRFIAEADLGRNEKIIAGFERRAWRRPNGFVNDVFTDRTFTSAWEDTQRQPERTDAALTFYYGGDEATAALCERARVAARQAVEHLDAALPGTAAAFTGSFLRTRWSRDPLQGGAYANFRPGQLTLFAPFLYIEDEDPAARQDVLVDRIAFAGEHLSDSFYGFMDGAAQTGRLAADAIARSIGVTVTTAAAGAG